MSIYTVCAGDLDPSVKRTFIEIAPRGGRVKLPALVEQVLVSLKEDKVSIRIRFYCKLKKRYGHRETLIRRKTDPIHVLGGKLEEEITDGQ